MVDTVHDPLAAVQAMRPHVRTFRTFSKLVLLAILHIVLVLAAALIAVILGVGGTVALTAAFAIY